MSDGKTITDERLEDLIELASNAHNLWNDESSRTALAGWLELQSARVELERMRAANQWQPIETAPRDSSSRLVWCPEHRNTFMVAWDPNAYQDEGMWRIFGGPILHDKPTHWRTRPAAPNEVAGS